MNKIIRLAAIAITLTALSGCYYDPAPYAYAPGYGYGYGYGGGYGYAPAPVAVGVVGGCFGCGRGDGGYHRGWR